MSFEIPKLIICVDCGLKEGVEITVKYAIYRSGGITRRAFLGAAAAGGATLLTGGWPSFARTTTKVKTIIPGEDGPWFEASILTLQALMASGQLTSRELTLAYLHRIGYLNPLLSAVIETNPNAVAIAAGMDNERRQGYVRGPLHGIPVLIKDNIASADRMQTTAGSLALVNSRVPSDAPLVQKLRDAGAVILGKANLSEWANFRGFGSFNGWSARGGFTRDPYVLDFDPSGSSTGSAVAPATNMCAAAVGTETDGSILSPSGNNLIVGLKPTLGLISQQGIVPIAHSQDTAGPMARTVTDVAILLGIMQTPFGEVLGHPLPSDYTVFLQRGALNGARIGVDPRYFEEDYFADPSIVAVVETAMDVMVNLGASIIETAVVDPWDFYDPEFSVLLYEFKVDMANYLAPLQHTSMRTLADLIAFNQIHCPQEMKYFGQELFEIADATSGNLSDPDYLNARALCLQLTRTEGIDAAIARDNLDAIVAPSWSWGCSPSAIAGYPDISVPVGFTLDGRPAGIWMYSGFLQEPKLLALAYDLEQEIQARSDPLYLGAMPPEPDDAGICEALATKPSGKKAPQRHVGRGKPIRPAF